MVKTVFLCRRRPDIDHRRYEELLLRGHVPLAIRHHPTMRRYVVNIVDRSHRDAPELDSIGELWFDALDDFHHRLYDSPEGADIIARDVAGFMGGADAYATTEHVQRRPPAAPRRGDATPAVKFVAAIRRSPALDHGQFVRHWLDRHVPLVLTDPLVIGYVNSVVDGALRGDPPAFDGFAELYFASPEDLATHVAMAGERYAAIRDDLSRFLGGAAAWQVTEYVQL